MADLVPEPKRSSERVDGLVFSQRHVAGAGGDARKQGSQLAAKNSANSALSRLTPINPPATRSAYLEPKTSVAPAIRDLSLARRGSDLDPGA
jgi:hypothetical protein